MVLAHNCTDDQAEQCARLLLLAGRYQEERLRLFIIIIIIIKLVT